MCVAISVMQCHNIYDPSRSWGIFFLKLLQLWLWWLNRKMGLGSYLMVWKMCGLVDKRHSMASVSDVDGFPSSAKAIYLTMDLLDMVGFIWQVRKPAHVGSVGMILLMNIASDRQCVRLDEILLFSKRTWTCLSDAIHRMRYKNCLVSRVYTSPEMRAWATHGYHHP